MKKLTIGMACYDDFHGVCFTVQSLLLHHPTNDVEILVVDNHPNSRHGLETASLLNKLQRSGKPIRYITMPESVGTTQSRQRVFDEAAGEWVMCMDCHVLLPPKGISSLLQYIQRHSSSQDIISGPLMRDEGGYYTHFNKQWRGEMYGTWGIAWQCQSCQMLVTTRQYKEQCEILAVSNNEPLLSCACGPIVIPQWSGHENELMRANFRPYGFNDSDQPFEVPGHGLGLFACRKAAWPGFNPHMRSFGGEELYIHEKFHQQGGKAICLPPLKWWHRFGKPDGIKYPVSTWGKLRNYVLGFQELGLDLKPVFDHFVSTQVPEGYTLYEHLKYEHCYSDQELSDKSEDALLRMHVHKKIPRRDWDALVADPIKTIAPLSAPPKPAPPNIGGQQLHALHQQPPAPDMTLDELFEWCVTIKRDLEQHMPLLRTLASRCKHVTELTKRRESTLAIVAGGPTEVSSYQQEPDLLIAEIHRCVSQNNRPRGGGEKAIGTQSIRTAMFNATLMVPKIDPTDMLYIDTVHSGNHLLTELARHAEQVRHYIVLRGTGAFGRKAEGLEEPGMFSAIRAFIDENPDWFVMSHTNAEYGMTVLSKDPTEKPPAIITPWPIGKGPGTELHLILADLNINPSASCDCRAKAEQMDIWGVQGCLDNRDVIIGWLKEGQDRWGWGSIFAAATAAVWSGLAFKLNPLDPIPGLVDEAIRRAKNKEASNV